MLDDGGCGEGEWDGLAIGRIERAAAAVLRR
jgi:hypothetical protein